MAEAAAPSLGDFFKAKSKKKVKASNLNKAEEKKEEAKIVKTSKEDDAWEEEQVVAATMKVEVVGKLMREEEKKEEEDTSAPAWGNISKSKDNSAAGINERKYPTLAKSVGSSAINVDDGSDAKVNIKVSKNVFAALEGDEDEEEQGSKRPKEIKPAMVTKKQGEREKVAIQREVDKYSTKKVASKKKANKEQGEDDDDEEEEDEGQASEEEEAIVEEKAPEKKEKVKKEKAAKPGKEDDEQDGDLAEDLRIQVDLVLSKEKYQGRRRLAPKALPREELEEEKENKPIQQVSSKKKKFVAQEETDKKLQYADW